MSYVNLDKTDPEKGKLWMYGVVKRVSNGTWLDIKNARTKYNKVGEGAEILWGGVTAMNFLVGMSTEKFNPNPWNNDKVGAWYMDVGNIDYGLK